MGMIGGEEGMIMWEIVEAFDRMVKMGLGELEGEMQRHYVMSMSIGRKGLRETFEAEARWTHWKDMWRCFLAQEARNLGIIGIKALFFTAKFGRLHRFR